MSAGPTLTVTTDLTKQFNEVVKSFKRDAVLIGIPATDDPREDDKKEKNITNAALLAINHFGSPANNIPPRQPLTIGIKKAQESIAEQFKLAARNALTQGTAALETYYERAGIIAANSVKKAINDQEGFPGPKESTLKARKYATKSGFKGTKALIVTGQMRNAITYVVRSIWGT